MALPPELQPRDGQNGAAIGIGQVDCVLLSIVNQIEPHYREGERGGRRRQEMWVSEGQRDLVCPLQEEEYTIMSI